MSPPKGKKYANRNSSSTFKDILEQSANNPLVSIGIPTYNRPDTLRRLLEQITSQTYKNLEIIISDNCSTDPDVQRVGNKFAVNDPRVRFVRQKENLGPEENHFFLRKQFRGKLMMFAHDDDEFPPNYVSACIKRWAQDPNIVVVGTPAKRYLNGRFWVDYKMWSSERQDTYDRLKSLIPLGFDDRHDCFEQYYHGLIKTNSVDSSFKHSGFRAIYMMLFILSEKGFFVSAEDTYMIKHTTDTELRKYESGEWVKDRLIILQLLGRHLEETIPVLSVMCKTIVFSKKLSVANKRELILNTIATFISAYAQHLIIATVDVGRRGLRKLLAGSSLR